MKKSIADLWIKALKSGKFKQGKSALKIVKNKKKAQHCCLGVLCELYIQETGKGAFVNSLNPEEAKKGYRPFSFVKKDQHGSFLDQNSSLLLAEVQEWAGMKTDSGDLSDYVGKKLVKAGLLTPDVENEYDTALTGLNDVQGLSFKQIAKVVKDHWRSL